MKSQKSINRLQQRVLVLGGTGSIGGAVAVELLSRGHDVTCLARNEKSAQILKNANLKILNGDIRQPEKWIKQVLSYDAIIQAACTWSDDMQAVEEHLISCLINELDTANSEKTFIYTGGCWVYGNTGSQAATEDTAYEPLPEFSWMIRMADLFSRHKTIRGMIIHPAMVYEYDGGVFEHMIDDSKQLGRIQIVGSSNTRWTMVNRRDLAQLYALVLEKGKKGEHYNGSSIEGIEIGKIADVLAKRYGISNQHMIISAQKAAAQWGSWAEGYGLDQVMSSEKAISQLGWAPEYTDILKELA